MVNSAATTPAEHLRDAIAHAQLAQEAARQAGLDVAAQREAQAASDQQGQVSGAPGAGV